MLTKPKVCVVIPVFNRSQRLRRAVHSVLEQTYTNYQLIVVDDASTIDLRDIHKLVEGEGHHWLQLKNNMGPAEARNLGVAESDTDWITFLDSDDEWYPGKLEQQIAWHLNHPEFRISQVNEKWYRKNAPFQKPAHLQQLGGDIFFESIKRCVIGPSCVMLHRELWQEHGGFNPLYRVCEDYELWLRIGVKEFVGLVDGQAMVKKCGGYADQLSLTTPAMDSYRLVALAKLLNESNLNTEQCYQVALGITARAEILAKGAGKRGDVESQEFFENIQVPLDDAAIETVMKFWKSAR